MKFFFFVFVLVWGGGGGSFGNKLFLRRPFQDLQTRQSNLLLLLLFCPVNINQWQSSNPTFEAVKYTTLYSDSDYWLVFADFSFALIWCISSVYLPSARGSDSSWEVEKFHSPPPSCEPPSLFISNVSSGTEEPLFPPPWCRLQRGIQMREPGEASWGSSILRRFAHRNRLLSQQERAGVSWPRVRFCLSLLQDFIKKHKNTQTKNTSSSALSCNSIIHTSLLQGDLSRNSQGCRIETPRKRGLSAEILAEV